MKCECGEEIRLIQGGHYSPTGASGGGNWYFRCFDLYKCPICEKHFYIEKKTIVAKPFKA